MHLRKTNKIYTGSAKNLKERLASHQLNKVFSTKFKDPDLLHYECFKLKSDAQRHERYLKTTEGKRFLRQQLRDVLEEIDYHPEKQIYSEVV